MTDEFMAGGKGNEGFLSKTHSNGTSIKHKAVNRLGQGQQFKVRHGVLTLQLKTA